MVEAGVPTIELRQDASRYFDIHHTPNDTADKLDPQALAQVSVAFAHVVVAAADKTVSFGRVPSDKRNAE